MSQVKSFDVFDTVLTRAVGSPASVFLLLGRRLASMGLIPCTAEAFAHARVGAERRARINRGQEISLGEIYQELAASLSLSEVRCTQIMDLECAVEDSLMRVVPGAHERLREARAGGQRVVFVSDMYLSSAFIQQQLTRHGLCDPASDRCYVSCDIRTTKHSGHLFREMLQQERVEAGLVTHCGNDAVADVHAAKAVGITAQPFLQGNLNRFEQILESQASATEGLSSALAAASRLTRLAVKANTPADADLRDVAAGVAAPTLIGYVLWILWRAEQLGLKRLYFVSRDGQILLAIARRLAAKIESGVELRYLYGSRQAWHLPSIKEVDLRRLDWILEETDFMSVSSVLARVCVEPTDVGRLLEQAGLNESDWARNLTDSERQRLGELLHEEELQTLILRRAAEKRQVLLRYLRQEGLLETADWAMVDLGWRGRLQNSLSAILGEVGAGPPRGFYFGLASGPVDESGGCREAYFFDKRHGIGYGTLDPTFANLMEVFCSATHGMVVGYEDQGEQVVPRLQAEGNDLAVNWGLPLLQETVCQYADHLLLSQELVNPRADIRAPIAEVLEAFWCRPTRAEALVWAGFPAEDDQSGAFWKTFAQQYTWVDVLRAYRYGRIHRHHSISWVAGSLVITPPPIRFALRVAARIGRGQKSAFSAARRVIRPTVPASTRTDGSPSLSHSSRPHDQPQLLVAPPAD